MIREHTALDVLHTEYTDLLLAIDPKLAKAYKKSLAVSGREKKEKKEKTSPNLRVSVGEEGGDGVDEENHGSGKKRKSKSKNTSKERKGDGDRDRDVREESSRNEGIFQSELTRSPIREAGHGRGGMEEEKGAERESKAYWEKQGAWETNIKHVTTQESYEQKRGAGYRDRASDTDTDTDREGKGKVSSRDTGKMMGKDKSWERGEAVTKSDKGKDKNKDKDRNKDRNKDTDKNKDRAYSQDGPKVSQEPNLNRYCSIILSSLSVPFSNLDII